MPGPLPAPDDTAAVARLRVLVGNLPQAAAADAAIVETHISLLLLAGGDAWKFKKPVRLPFADFSAAAENGVVVLGPGDAGVPVEVGGVPVGGGAGEGDPGLVGGAGG